MLIVGIGEMVFSENTDEVIVTHALGSCVAIIMHCTKTRKTAMAHVVLPHSKGDDQLKQAYYADATTETMLHYFRADGRYDKKSLRIQLIGGADARNRNDIFKVGARNIASISKVLKANYMTYVAEEIGGHYSRTVTVNVGNGEIGIYKQRMRI